MPQQQYLISFHSIPFISSRDKEFGGHHHTLTIQTKIVWKDQVINILILSSHLSKSSVHIAKSNSSKGKIET